MNVSGGGKKHKKGGAGNEEEMLWVDNLLKYFDGKIAYTAKVNKRKLKTVDFGEIEYED